MSFVNDTTVSVVMAPLPGYAVDTSEDAQLRAPFAAVVYCNGSELNPPWLVVTDDPRRDGPRAGPPIERRDPDVAARDIA